MNLSIRAEHIDAILVGFGILYIGAQLIIAMVVRRRPT